MTTLLRTSALDAFYGDFQALFGVDFEIARGEIVAVIGANGAGKSTLLKSVAGLIANRHDALRWGDDAIGDRPAAEGGGESSGRRLQRFAIGAMGFEVSLRCVSGPARAPR
jgi:ABC-type branched-subunit amino acid transport system ATPase component